MRAADRLMLRTVTGSGHWLWVLVTTTLTGAGLELALPYVLGRSVDTLVSTGSAVRTWPLTAFGVIVALLACETLGSWAGGASGAQAAAGLRRALTTRVLLAGPALTRRIPEGDLTTRLGLNAEEAGQAGSAAVTAAAVLLPTVGSVVALTLIDFWLALTLVAGLALVALVLRAFFRDTTVIAGGYQRAQGEIAVRLTDALTGARTIAATGTAHQETRRILQPLPALRARGIELWRANARAGVQAGLAVPLVEVAVLAVGGARLAGGGLSIGDLYAAARYAVLGVGLSSALGVLGTLARARSASERVAEVLAVPGTGYGPMALPPGPGTLEFRGVVLPHGPAASIDLTVAGGSLTAVVGRSGAGKSQLAAVAARLAEPRAGTVLLDGVPLAALSRTALRDAIGYAPERPVLVGETLADAIWPGGPGVEFVRRAARAACADGFIGPLPHGYATALADAPLSGGERQRVGLARAFARAGRLLVLDDATASLDTVSEGQVIGALAADPAGRTRLVVTHRTAVAARADLVLWLEDGRVRGRDRHRALWRDPAYRAVFQAESPS